MNFLIVVYLEEVPLLEISLSSFAQTTDPGTITSMTIAVNETNQDRRIRCRVEVERVVSNMGSAWKDRIRVNDLNDYVKTATNAGYVNQQIVKLMHALRVESDYYIVLDAKNLVARQITASTHFIDDGRAKMHFMTYTDSYQRYMIDIYYNIFGVAPERRLYDLPAMMTPFVFSQKMSRDLIAYCVKNFDQPFEVFFAHQEHFSEFLMYAAFIVARSIPIETIYVRSPQNCLILWPESQTSASDLKDLFGSLESMGYDYFGIHRRKILALHPDERKAYVDYLYKRGIRSDRLELLLSTIRPGMQSD